MWTPYHFLYTGLCHLQIGLVLLLPFPRCITSFSSLFVLARIPVQCLRKVAKADIFVLFLMLGESIQSFTSKYNVSCGFFRLGKLFSIPNLSGFIIRRCCILSNSFSVSIEMPTCFLSSILLMRCIT